MTDQDRHQETEPTPAEMRVDTARGLPRIMPAEDLPRLTDEEVRASVEAVRR